jgi:hypothetical protein
MRWTFQKRRRPRPRRAVRLRRRPSQSPLQRVASSTSTEPASTTTPAATTSTLQQTSTTPVVTSTTAAVTSTTPGLFASHQANRVESCNVGCGVGALSNVVSSCEQRVIDGRANGRTDGRTECVHTADKCWSDASDAEKRTCGLGSRLVCSAVRRYSQTTNERRLAKWSVVSGLAVRLAEESRCVSAAGKCDATENETWRRSSAATRRRVECRRVV